MSRLLLAQAASLLRWSSDAWRDGWPDLLTAREIATLDSCGETGNPDPKKRAALLALFENCPPVPCMTSPNTQGGQHVIADGFKPGLSITTGGYHDPWDGWKPCTTVEGSPIPAYRSETYRQWDARDWEPSPFIAAWFEAYAGGKDPLLQDLPIDDRGQVAASGGLKIRKPRQTEVNQWLLDEWQAGGCQGGMAFFRHLKSCKGKPGSPVVEWYQSGRNAGIEYETGAGNRGRFSRKAIRNKVSQWKNGKR